MRLCARSVVVSNSNQLYAVCHKTRLDSYRTVIRQVFALYITIFIAICFTDNIQIHPGVTGRQPDLDDAGAAGDHHQPDGRGAVVRCEPRRPAGWAWRSNIGATTL